MLDLNHATNEVPIVSQQLVSDIATQTIHSFESNVTNHDKSSLLKLVDGKKEQCISVSVATSPMKLWSSLSNWSVSAGANWKLAAGPFNLLTFILYFSLRSLYTTKQFAIFTVIKWVVRDRVKLDIIGVEFTYTASTENVCNIATYKAGRVMAQVCHVTHSFPSVGFTSVRTTCHVSVNSITD